MEIMNQKNSQKPQPNKTLTLQDLLKGQNAGDISTLTSAEEATNDADPDALPIFDNLLQSKLDKIESEDNQHLKSLMLHNSNQDMSLSTTFLNELLTLTINKELDKIDNNKENESNLIVPKERMENIYRQTFNNSCVMKQPSRAENIKLEPCQIITFKLERYQSHFLQISCKSRKPPLFVVLKMDDLSQQGLQIYWSKTHKFPKEENSDGFFIV